MKNAPAKNSKKISVTLLLGFLCFAFFIGLLIKIVFDQSRNSFFAQRPWRIHILLPTQPASILSIAANEGDYHYLIVMPPELMVNVPGGYGLYRLDKIPQLSKIEKNNELLTDTLTQFLGVRLHAQISSEPVSLPDSDDLITPALHVASFQKVITQTQNLSFYDRLVLAQMISQISNRTIQTIDLRKQTNLFEIEELPDRTKILRPDDAKIDSYFQEKFEDTQVRNENISVSVSNATDVPFLAQKFTRFVTQFGGKVITVGNEKRQEAVCSLETTEENRNKRLVQYLEKEFNCRVIITPSQSAVDVQILVGDFFAQRFK